MRVVSSHFDFDRFCEICSCVLIAIFVRRWMEARSTLRLRDLLAICLSNVMLRITVVQSSAHWWQLAITGLHKSIHVLVCKLRLPWKPLDSELSSSITWLLIRLLFQRNLAINVFYLLNFGNYCWFYFWRILCMLICFFLLTLLSHILYVSLV